MSAATGAARSGTGTGAATAAGGSVVIKLAYADTVHRFVVPDPWFHTVTAVSTVVAKPSPSATVGVGPWHRLMALLQRTLQFSPQQMRSVFVYAEDEDDFVVPITNDTELRKCVELSQQQMNAAAAAATARAAGTGTAGAAAPKTLKLFISHDPPSPSAALSKPLIVRASSSAPVTATAGGDDKQAAASAATDGGAVDTGAGFGASAGVGVAVDGAGEEGRATFHAADLDAAPVADFALSLDSDYFGGSTAPATGSSSSGNSTGNSSGGAQTLSPAPPLRPAPASPPVSTAHSGNGNSGKGNGPGSGSGRGSGKAGSAEEDDPAGGGVVLMGDIKVVDWHFGASAHPANATPTPARAMAVSPSSSSSSSSAGVNALPVLWSSSPSKPWQRLAPFVEPALASSPPTQSARDAVITRGLFAPALPVSPALPTLPAGTANARFVASPKTLADGCVVVPGRPVVQHWVFRNTGSRAWPTPTRLVYCHGNAHDTPFPPVPIPSIAPGQQVTIALTVHLPHNADGRYWAVYRLCGAAAGADTGSCRFGDSVWLDVMAKSERQQQQERASKRIAIEPAR